MIVGKFQVFCCAGNGSLKWKKIHPTERSKSTSEASATSAAEASLTFAKDASKMERNQSMG
jgi:hypothetical protein